MSVFVNLETLIGFGIIVLCGIIIGASVLWQTIRDKLKRGNR